MRLHPSSTKAELLIHSTCFSHLIFYQKKMCPIVRCSRRWLGRRNVIRRFFLVPGCANHGSVAASHHRKATSVPSEKLSLVLLDFFVLLNVFRSSVKYAAL